ncbi:hypothetical protein V8F33_013119 [Rhypophila sp. PSN 637]
MVVKVKMRKFVCVCCGFFVVQCCGFGLLVGTEAGKVGFDVWLPEHDSMSGKHCENAEGLVADTGITNMDALFLVIDIIGEWSMLGTDNIAQSKAFYVDGFCHSQGQLDVIGDEENMATQSDLTNCS